MKTTTFSKTREVGIKGTWRFLVLKTESQPEVWAWCPRCGGGICLDDNGILEDGKCVEFVYCKKCDVSFSAKLINWNAVDTMYPSSLNIMGQEF